MTDPATRFLRELLSASRVVFINGDMVVRRNEWYAYKNDHPELPNAETTDGT